MKIQKKFHGFTLIELIIVVTILAILASIAFVSFSQYTKNSRDTNRLVTLNEIQKALDIYITTTTKYPFPDSAVSLSFSGEIIGYQGVVGDSISEKLKLGQTPKDPKTAEYYYYSVNSKRNKASLGTYYENFASQMISHTYADDNKYFKTIGNNFGFLLDQNKNVIKVNTELKNNPITFVLMSEQNTLTSSGNAMSVMENGFKKSCLDILNSGWSKGDGKYSISVDNTTFSEVTCDMQGGGYQVFDLDVDDFVQVRKEFANYAFVEVEYFTNTSSRKYSNISFSGVTKITDIFPTTFTGKTNYEQSFFYGGYDTGSCTTARFRAWEITPSSVKGSWCGYMYSEFGKRSLLLNTADNTLSNIEYLGYNPGEHTSICKINNQTMTKADCHEYFKVRKIKIK